MSFDYIIVGAGIAGITAAEELANTLNKKILLIDKKDHIGGNCYDYYNDNGNIIHKYGPHVFNTNNIEVYNYLSLFTHWKNYNHKIIFKVNDELIPVPFNFISIDKILKYESEEIKKALIENYKVKERITIKELKESENSYIRILGNTIYDIFAKYYKKLYLIDDEEVKEFIYKMYPFRMSYDCRFYDTTYQIEPIHGYTSMFKNMLSNHNITVLLNKDYHEIIDIDFEEKKIYYEGKEFEGHLIFTGMIDEFFNYEFGELKYNSLILENEEIENSTFQEASIIYYPEDNHFTQISDFKYISGDYLPTTVIQFEYPVEYNKKYEEQSIPYYPIDLEKNKKTYYKYRKLAEYFENVTFVGRLAEYKLLKMDEVVEEVLNLINNKFAVLEENL